MMNAHLPQRLFNSTRTPLLLLSLALLAACGSVPESSKPGTTPTPGGRPPEVRPGNYFSLSSQADRHEVVMFALGLIDTRYVFGGRNPDAGLDCSGMVSYVVEQVSGKRLPHNAASIAALTRPVSRSALQPGDLVFFNTMQRKHSHMGIYLGDGKFVHAPSSKGRGKVRVERLDSSYFASRLDGMRTMVNDS